jgi:hypothetical protein
MAVLDDVKTILNINDTLQDNILNLYIRKAVTLITIYLNIPTTPTITKNRFTGEITTTQPIDVATTYPDAVVEYVLICQNKRGNEGIKQFNLSGDSGTFANDLPDSVIALLPQPYISMQKAKGHYYDRD